MSYQTSVLGSELRSSVRAAESYRLLTKSSLSLLQLILVADRNVGNVELRWTSSCYDLAGDLLNYTFSQYMSQSSNPSSSALTFSGF